MFRSSSKPKHEKGQGLVEYALILVLVSIVVIVALSALGPTISNIFTNINASLGVGGGGGSVAGTTIDCGFYGSATLSCPDDWNLVCNPGPVCNP
jgi:pilus assembly protein Flp/PilA